MNLTTHLRMSTAVGWALLLIGSGAFTACRGPRDLPPAGWMAGGQGGGQGGRHDNWNDSTMGGGGGRGGAGGTSVAGAAGGAGGEISPSGGGGGRGGYGVNGTGGPMGGFSAGGAGGAGTGGLAAGGGGGSVAVCSQLQCGTACVNTDTDPKNCGNCGHDCLGSACSNGICTPTIVVPTSGHELRDYAIAPGSTYAYYVTDEGLYRTMPGTGVVQELDYWRTISPSLLCIDASTTYLLAGQGIYSEPLAGGGLGAGLEAAKVLFSGNKGIWDFKILEGTVYTVETGSRGYIYGHPTGAEPTLMAQGSEIGCQANPQRKEGWIYFAAGSDILRVPSGGGGNPETVTTTLGGEINSFLIAGEAVLVGNAAGLTSFEGVANTANHLADGPVREIQADTAGVYWLRASDTMDPRACGRLALASSGPGDIYALKSGSKPIKLATVPRSGTRLTLNGPWLYWTDGAGLYRVAR